MQDLIKEIAKQYGVNIRFARNGKLGKKSRQNFENEVHWDYISIHQKLSEGFIREFQDKVNWVSISISQKLSEDFIREFQDKVHWYCISR